MAIGLALSGVSNSGHDVGGFAGPAPSPELLLRWVQAGVLMPRFSIHSWNDDCSVNEPWMYAEALPAIRRLMALRQRLVPFFYDLLLRYHVDWAPMVRPTWLDFPDDPGAWAESDDHLLGPDVLAAPIVEPGAAQRIVRPPAGADWIDVWTGAHLVGGVTTTLDAALDGPPPLLARAGSGMLVDLAEGGWKPQPYQRGIWLFPPREGSFEWSAFEDSGDGHGPPDRWHLTGQACADRIVIEIKREGVGCDGDDLTILLPPGDGRSLRIDGVVCVQLGHGSRQGWRVKIPLRPE